jgi:hypothetical protein
MLGGQLLEGLETQPAGERQHHHLAGDPSRRHRCQCRMTVAQVGESAEHRRRAQRSAGNPRQGVLGNRQRRASGTRDAHAAAGNHA